MPIKEQRAVWPPSLVLLPLPYPAGNPGFVFGYNDLQVPKGTSAIVCHPPHPIHCSQKADKGDDVEEFHVLED